MPIRSERSTVNYFSAYLPSALTGQGDEQRVDTPRNLARARDHLATAKTGAFFSLPVATMFCVAITHDKIYFAVPAAVAGLVIDTVKLPFAAAFTFGALGRAAARSVCYVKYLLPGKSPHDQQYSVIAECFRQRLELAGDLLMHAGVETADSLNAILRNKSDETGLKYLCCMTLLLTAFASRGTPANAIVLANGKVLRQRDCPKKGQDLFRLVTAIRDDLRALGLHRRTNSEAAPEIIRMLQPIKDALVGNTTVDTRAFDPHTAQLVRSIVAKLRLVGDEASKQKSVFGKRKRLRPQQGFTPVLVPPERPQQPAVVVAPVDSAANAAADDVPAMEFDWSATCDFHTGKRVDGHLVLGDNGYFYAEESAKKLIAEGKLRKLVRVYDSADPRIDPITFEELEMPVLANDGHFYSLDTAQRMELQRARGVAGVKLTSWILCQDPELDRLRDLAKAQVSH